MEIFDPHIHMTWRSTDDYEAMAKAGIPMLSGEAPALLPRLLAMDGVDVFLGKTTASHAEMPPSC